MGKKSFNEGERDELEGGLKGKPVSSSAKVSKVITQAFTLTFLAEWGDRSQVIPLIQFAVSS